MGGLADHEWAADAADPRRARRAARRCRGQPVPAGPRHADRAAVRRRAPPDRARAAVARPAPTCCCWTSRRTTSTSRASTGWPATCAARRGGRGRDARPLVPRRRLHADVGGRGGTRAPVRGRLRRLGAGPGRARPASPPPRRSAASNLLRKELAWLRRGPPARTSKPRFRIDAANALIADEPAPRDRVELLRFATARLGTPVVDARGRRRRARRPAAAAPAHVAARAGRPRRAGRRERLRQDDAAARAARPAGAGLGRASSAARPCGSAFLSQELEDLDGDVRVLESLESVRRGSRSADGRELTAGAAVRAVRLRRQARLDARRATSPAASAGACS